MFLVMRDQLFQTGEFVRADVARCEQMVHEAGQASGVEFVHHMIRHAARNRIRCDGRFVNEGPPLIVMPD